LVWATKKFKLINSWDHFVIPFPFSKGVYTFGEPIYVDKKINKKKFEISRLEVENEIKRLTKLINNESN
tara:strand:- start:483 stop:689 length:207 start_codon:yes stop_codon:yes gene_type:complete